MERNHPLDPWIAAADRALRALFAPAQASRPVPGEPPSPPDLARPHSASEESPRFTGPAQVAPAHEPAATHEAAIATQRRRSAGLMRVNHSGEIAAQALYHG